MYHLKQHVFYLFLASLLVLQGCASAPMASNAEDQRAKQFKPAGGKASIYVYRNETMGAALSKSVTINGRMAGTTAADTYFWFHVKPGTYKIVSDNNLDNAITIKAKAGKNYFIWQEMKMGLFVGGTQLSVVDEKTGRNGVLECKLIRQN